MIYVTGDVHGNWMNRLRSKSFPEQKEMTRSDYVIILGDFGIWDDSDVENHNLDWLEAKPFTTLFIDGNHENYDLLDNYKVEMWNGGKVHKIRPHVIHLMRGQVFTINNKKFFTFGGASSHDISDGILEPGDPRIKIWSRDYYKMFRVNHVSWWERELPNEDEMDEGITNMTKNNWKVDFILTHCPYASLNAFLLDNTAKQDVLTKYLQTIRDKAQYDHWLMGHLHINHTIPYEKCSILYEQIIRIN